MQKQTQQNRPEDESEKEFKVAKLEMQKMIEEFFATLRQYIPVYKIVILSCIAILAFFVRVFSVIRFESVIHEFDPWFNFRTTKFLTQKGWDEFWNWFDSESWYPLGRVIGGTIFPGIMGTAAGAKWLLDFLSFPMDIRNVCVFLAPVFSGFTAISTYFFAKECTNKVEVGLLSALFISIVPSYISRSVAGSYDNEGVAIWALVTTFYLWIKAVNTGSIMWAVACTLQYYYMVAAWGGYAFIINIIPIFVIGIIFIDKFDMKIYIAYSVFYSLGTVLATTIPFVTYNAIKSSEHLASHCVFILMNAYVLMEYLRKNLPEREFKGLIKVGMTLVVVSFTFVFVYLTASGNTKWSGRSMTLLDPTYAKKYLPIVASVSEHQPTSWTSYFFDLGYILMFMPVGYYYCLTQDVTYGKIFIGIYGVLATYFSSVMVRLMLTLAPIVCVISAIGIAEILNKTTSSMRNALKNIGKETSSDEQQADALTENESSSAAAKPTSQSKSAKKKASSKESIAQKVMKNKDAEKKTHRYLPCDISFIFTFFLFLLMCNQVYHSNFIAAESYASPSIIMATRNSQGDRVIVDDYREAYYWLKQNTEKDARILSWWDYGYQITGMANRTVLVDNNTWNNTHIATVGRAFASDEQEGHRIAKYMGADYVLVIFGGLANFSGDDISKFIWMIRIAAGVFPQVKENNFLDRGSYTVGEAVTDTMKNSLMYKLCYYKFDEVRSSHEHESGYDNVRKVSIGHKGFDLEYFEEAFTSNHWLVRIFRMLPEKNLEPKMKTRHQTSVTSTPLPNKPKLSKPEL